VRPLPYADASFTGQISRDHITTVQEPDDDLAFPVYNLIGGKWTTFRAFAEQVTDKVVARLNKARSASTELLPIGGGKDYPADSAGVQQWIKQTAENYNLQPERVTELFDRYGTRTAELAAFISAGEDQPLSSFPAFSRRELTYLVRREHVAHLDDVILRRSLLAWLGDLSLPLLTELAEIAGEVLGWSAAQQKAEVTRTVDIMREYHGVDL
jgi:glycerol-3-phosphate dehydrogenase